MALELTTRIAFASLCTLLLLVGCAPAPRLPLADRGGEGDSPATPKRLAVAIMGEPKAVGLAANLSAVPGEDELTELLLAGLSTVGKDGVPRPKLAERVPSVENGLWVVFPDGRMETTWRIRPNAHWQDGTPITADDFAFTARLNQDPALASSSGGYTAIDSVETPDPATVVVKWKRLFLRADTAFDSPVPRHLMERPYAEEPASFLGLPYWTEGFVGTGPFRVERWTHGSHVILRAYDQYVLGRPRIDEVEVKFIPDQNTLIANVLAGSIEMTMGRGISLEQALQVKEQWPAGRVLTGAGNPTVIFPQLGNPNPAIVGERRFRQAALQAIDRPNMVQTFFGGLSTVASAGIGMSEADRKDLENSFVEYPYDLRAAARLLDELGYAKGADGRLRDGKGDVLALPLNTDPSNDMQPKATFVVADSWRQLGIEVELQVLPAQQLREAAWKSEFRAFSVRRNPVRLDRLENYFHSKQIPTPENGYRGANYSAYRNPEVDGLIDRFSSAVARTERLQLAGQLLHRLTDQVVIIGLFYDVEVTLAAERIKNLTGRSADSGEAWNAELWDLV